MAREEGFEVPPYTNLKSYQAYKKQGAEILNIPADEVESEAEDQAENYVEDEIVDEDK